MKVYFTKYSCVKGEMFFTGPVIAARKVQTLTLNLNLGSTSKITLVFCSSCNKSLNQHHIANSTTMSTKPEVSLVLGSQWGDEGKGKVVDVLACHVDLVCRCQVSFFSLLVQ